MHISANDGVVDSSQDGVVIKGFCNLMKDDTLNMVSESVDDCDITPAISTKVVCDGESIASMCPHTVSLPMASTNQPVSEDASLAKETQKPIAKCPWFRHLLRCPEDYGNLEHISPEQEGAALCLCPDCLPYTANIAVDSVPNGGDNVSTDSHAADRHNQHSCSVAFSDVSSTYLDQIRHLSSEDVHHQCAENPRTVSIEDHDYSRGDVCSYLECDNVPNRTQAVSSMIEHERLLQEFAISHNSSDVYRMPCLSSAGSSNEARVSSAPVHREKLHISGLFSACVARPVGRHEINRTPAAQMAMRTEWDRLVANEVFDMDSVAEWSIVRDSARMRGETIHHGSLATIVVEKGAELPEGNTSRKYKGRTVFLGDQVKDQNADTAIFEDLQSSPAAMEAGRVVDFWGCLPNHGLSTADGVQAYIQADLRGPKTWVDIPREHWPPKWFRADGSPMYGRPVVRLIKALYGHPNAGAFWEQECGRRLRTLGFAPIDEWPSVFFHAEEQCLLVVYVDDFKLAGPTTTLASMWTLIRSIITTTDPEPVTHFLGCDQCEGEHILDNGSIVRTMTYSMRPFLETCLSAYLELSGQPESSLSIVATPYLAEEAGSGPARRPCAKGPAITCECCGRSWPMDASADGVIDSNDSDDDEGAIAEEIDAEKIACVGNSLRLDEPPLQLMQWSSLDRRSSASADLSPDVTVDKMLSDSLSYVANSSQLHSSTTDHDSVMCPVCSCHRPSNSFVQVSVAGPLVRMHNEDGRVVTGRARMKRLQKAPIRGVTFDAKASDIGQLQPIAARVLMKVLYAARMCRFDLLRAVCGLATKITRWTASCDKRLHRLMSYIHSSLDVRLTGWVGCDATLIRPHLYTDADLAGCADTQRSTNGVYQCLRGPNSCFPIAIVCKRQSAVSHSTPEAELNALDLGLRTVALPARYLWEKLLSHPCPIVHEDNDVAIRIVYSGKNQTMRQLSRTPGISVAWLHESLEKGEFDLIYEPSATMCADIFTKSITNAHSWTVSCELVSLSRESNVRDLIRREGRPLPEPDGSGKRGRWVFREDGSGEWTRLDPIATKFRSLLGAGPLRSEVVCRTTYDAKSGDVLETMTDYSSAKFLNEPLPKPVPRSLRTVFAFDRTTKEVPPECRNPWRYESD